MTLPLLPAVPADPARSASEDEESLLPARLQAAVRVAAMVAVSCAAVVTASGIWLSRYYLPNPPPNAGWVGRAGGWIHEAHVWGAIALQGAVVVLLLAFAAGLAGRAGNRIRRSVVGAWTVLVAAVISGFPTSRGLRWRWLGLWAVTAGTTDLRGVWRAAFAHEVRFVIVPGWGTGEVAPDDYRQRVIAHVFGTPALVLAAGLLVAVAHRRLRDETSELTG